MVIKSKNKGFVCSIFQKSPCPIVFKTEMEHILQNLQEKHEFAKSLRTEILSIVTDGNDQNRFFSF